MDFLYYVILFIAIVSTSIYVTTVVNTWISIASIKDNFVDRQWLSRLCYLVLSAACIVYLISHS